MHNSVSRQPVANIGLAAVYVQLLAESNLLSPSLIHRLNLVEILRCTSDTLMLQILNSYELPAEILALNAASSAIANQIGRPEIDANLRFPYPLTYPELDHIHHLMRCVAVVDRTPSLSHDIIQQVERLDSQTYCFHPALDQLLSHRLQ